MTATPYLPSGPYPTTRYQGSKRKILPWIRKCVTDLEFEKVLDLFGGTGSVSYLFKKMGKTVTYNDYLHFNYLSGVALVENSQFRLEPEDINFILTDIEGVKYPQFVEETFEGFFFTREENRWIDHRVSNIRLLRNSYRHKELYFKQALAFYALFQSCLVKRPFNLFHRKNLYIRLNNVQRSFGNAYAWSKTFEQHYRRFSAEVNGLVFSNGKDNLATCKDAFGFKSENYDLVYIDPPYFSANRCMLACDYPRMYHFLEGLARYDEWPHLIDLTSSILSLRDGYSSWGPKTDLLTRFSQLFENHHRSIIILSYRSPGIPSISELTELLAKLGKKVSLCTMPYKYALQKPATTITNSEVLIIAH